MTGSRLHRARHKSGLLAPSPRSFHHVTSQSCALLHNVGIYFVLSCYVVPGRQGWGWDQGGEILGRRGDKEAIRPNV